MDQPIHILHLEDDPVDAELVQAKLEEASLTCRITRVQTRVEFAEALHRDSYDIILADFHLPMYDGMAALRLAQELCPDTPFIFVSGAMGEDAAIEGLTEGATDYVLKQKLSRLAPAIKRALQEAENWRERQRAEEALKTSEARLAGIIESAMDAIISVDDEQRIVLFNAAAEQMFGCTAAEVSGQPLERFIPERFRQAYQEQIRALGQADITGRARGGLGIVVGQRTNGEEFPIEASISQIETAGSKLYTIILRDITERQRTQEVRAKLEEQLRQAQKMESIGRLASGVAHDFNNLLTVIRGYTDLLQDSMTPEDPRVEDLEQIRRASERATALTRQLLAFSRQQILTPTVLDLNSLVANLYKMLERLIGEDISLSTLLQPGLWPITADPGQIEQVIMNLVVNARDAMPTGGKITIETGNIYLDDDYAQTHFEVPVGPCVMLAVADTGHGMDKPTQARIFEPFFTTKEQGQGTGLGLATVYGIVKQSGGHITVYSEPDQGTTFKLYLPAAETTAASLPAPQTQPVSQPGTETILLVEDDERVRSLAQRALQAEGYTILAACSGGEALSLVEQYQGGIDLLLTDVVMPQLNGRELAEQLKARHPQLKVLFMSGYTDDVVVRHGLLAAEIEFLPKPFSPNMLVSRVRQTLGA
jgi:PAS domain S-box-containing protein